MLAKLIDNVQFCVTECQTGRAKIWMQCVWNRSLVLFITFKAVTLAAILTSRCPLHNSGKWRNYVPLKWLWSDLPLCRKSPSNRHKHMCFSSRPTTSKYGNTEQTSTYESFQIWCHHFWRESRTHFAGLIGRSFLFYLVLKLIINRQVGVDFILLNDQIWSWILQKSLGTERSQFWASILAKWDQHGDLLLQGQTPTSR